MTWLAESLRLLLAQLKEIMKVLKEIRDLMKEGHMDKKPRLIDADSLLEFAHNHIGGMIDCNDIARFPAVEA